MTLISDSTFHVTRLIRDKDNKSIPAVLWPIITDLPDLGFFVTAALKVSFQNKEGGVEVRTVKFRA